MKDFLSSALTGLFESTKFYIIVAVILLPFILIKSKNKVKVAKPKQPKIDDEPKSISAQIVSGVELFCLIVSFGIDFLFVSFLASAIGDIGESGLFHGLAAAICFFILPILIPSILFQIHYFKTH